MSITDDLIGRFDKALRTLTGQQVAHRSTPAERLEEAPMSERERAHAAGLMRVNHTGEICAQALYEGQALTARSDDTRQMLIEAAEEEADHLVWCEERLGELDSRPSLLNPLFYGASYTLGAVTGLIGDRVSLGFVEATEHQVSAHLEDHLERLPEEDQRSRAIVATMREEEERHGANAIAAGGDEFPLPVKRAMRLVSRLMTETTYRI